MESAQTPVARVVLLGASNVVLGLRTAVRAARERLGGALEVYVACGHGRSYGTVGNVLGRTLPAISTCGLWSALDERLALPTFAVVTDVGNDLAFGFEPQEIEEWVDVCLAHLAGHSAQVVLTGLPLDALRRLPAWEFALFSRLFFPHRHIERVPLLDAAQELHERLERLTNERRLVWLAPRPEWYGHDPIHVQRVARREVWHTFVAPWKLAAPPKRPVSFDAPWKQRGRLVSRDRKLFGRAAGRAQPCASLADGTTFFLY